MCIPLFVYKHALVSSFGQKYYGLTRDPVRRDEDTLDCCKRGMVVAEKHYLHKGVWSDR
jgi:hypothetical protein